MKFEFEGQTYVIAFKHDLPETPGRETHCTIYRLDHNTLTDHSKVETGFRTAIAEGFGRCHPADQWTKEGGRTAALRNALDIGGAFDEEPEWSRAWNRGQLKAFRAAAWNAYQTRHWDAHVRQVAADAAAEAKRARILMEQAGAVLAEVIAEMPAGEA